MNPYRIGLSLYFFFWLALVLVPAVWALVDAGGHERLIACLEIILRDGFDTDALTVAAR